MLATLILFVASITGSAACGAAGEDSLTGEADYRMAQCLMAGSQGSPDYVRVRAYLDAARTKGYRTAACSLGEMMINGLGGPSDPPSGLKLCRKAAEGGDLESEVEYAGYALRGLAMPRDPAMARRLLTDAADKGQPLAALTLGDIYWNGDGTVKDNQAAAKYWRQAYAGGHPEAALLLGNEAYVRLTQVLSPDKADPAILREATDWFEKASVEDPAPGARNLANQRLAMLRNLASIVGRPLPAH